MASQQRDTVELLRERYEAFNDRELETVTEVFSEDIEWVCPEGYRYGGTYRGPEEVGDFFERVLSDIENLELDVDRFIDGGETVVVVGELRGTATETGNALDVPIAHVIDVEDGHITRFLEYTDTARFERAFEP